MVFDPLPRVAQVFEEFDVNGSGYLDFDEFSRMLPALGIHLPPSKVVRWLRSAGWDGVRLRAGLCVCF